MTVFNAHKDFIVLNKCAWHVQLVNIKTLQEKASVCHVRHKVLRYRLGRFTVKNVKIALKLWTTMWKSVYVMPAIFKGSLKHVKCVKAESTKKTLDLDRAHVVRKVQVLNQVQNQSRIASVYLVMQSRLTNNVFYVTREVTKLN
jgi:hypothetical protein